MRTVGVDLAADPASTAVAIIDWPDASAAGGRATVEVICPADDDAILRAADGADKVGIDCPLGWPDEFVALVSEHHAGAVTTTVDLASKAGRRVFAYRETDRFVCDHTGRWPLSVATDRIGLVALRAAGLLARLTGNGHLVDRSGVDGLVVEVYPAAAIKQWFGAHRRYKGTKHAAARTTLVDELRQRTPWLDFEAYVDRCATTDHAFDAVVAALNARAAALSMTYKPDDIERARREGWIALPTGTLDDLR